MKKILYISIIVASFAICGCSSTKSQNSLQNSSVNKENLPISNTTSMNAGNISANSRTIEEAKLECTLPSCKKSANMK